MLGYVQIYKADLKLREYEVYQGYYCGICKYIGKTYGQLPRMSLSYDAAFLALILACIEDEPDAPTQEHCVVHHIKKKTIIRNKAIEYAGDVMLILAWYKLLDDAQDEGKNSAKLLMFLLRHIHKKLARKYPSLCDGIEVNLVKLQSLEKAKCKSIDQAAEAFAKIMEVIFSEGSKLLHKKDNITETTAPDDAITLQLHDVYAKIGYHMGKWIYLMDAADDIEENIASGAYNPLLYRFEFGQDIMLNESSSRAETPLEFRLRIRERLEFNLYHYLAIIGESMDLLDIKKNKGIIDNIIYFGLNNKTEEILNKKDNK